MVRAPRPSGSASSQEINTTVKPAHALWPRLKKLLLARDAALIDQGVELVRSLGDAALFDTLLNGVGWAATPSPDASEERSFGALTTHGSLFEDAAPALSPLSRVCLWSLDLDDAKRIANLPAVTSLTMANSISFRDPSALASMTTLRDVDLAYCMQLTDVSALAALPLTRLRLHRTCVDRTRLPSSLRKVARWG